jgi:uncharacterized membrane protein YcaP (DUF421 family)
MHTYLEIGLRALITFFVLILVIRLQGKKQIAQFSYFNYINGIAIGSLAANVVLVRDVPIWESLFSVVLWAFITWVIAVLSLKSLTMRRLFEGVPRYMIKDGHILEENLRKENLTIEDLTSMLRQKNNFAIADAEMAILELDGKLSVQSRSTDQMVTREDLHLGEKKIGIAIPLIVDCVLMKDNLKANRLSEAWVESRLREFGIDIEQVFYMEMGVNGKIKIEKK